MSTGQPIERADMMPALRKFLEQYGAFYHNSGFIVNVLRGSGGMWNTPVSAKYDRARIFMRTTTPGSNNQVERAFVVRAPTAHEDSKVRVNIENPLPGMHSEWGTYTVEEAMRRFVDWAQAVLEKKNETE